MIGMDRHTGQPISGIEHLRQSVEDILSTPLLSRRERPEYGSKLRRMVDLPINQGWKSAAQAEANAALTAEPKRQPVRAFEPPSNGSSQNGAGRTQEPAEKRT